MSQQRQKNTGIIGEKKGVPIYRSNPSVPDPSAISKRKKRRYGNEEKGLIINKPTGEILNIGGAAFYEFEEVDDTRFVKLFLAGVKQAAGLSKSGLCLFEIIYKQLQENVGADEVKLSSYVASEEGMTERTYQRGLKELLDKEFIYRSPSDGVFFVNIQFMFNGDRLAFVKGYKRKGAADIQGQLALETPQDKKT